MAHTAEPPSSQRTESKGGMGSVPSFAAFDLTSADRKPSSALWHAKFGSNFRLFEGQRTGGELGRNRARVTGDIIRERTLIEWIRDEAKKNETLARIRPVDIA